GHPWLLQGDGKMSKSKGNVIYADDLVDMFGRDAVRYFVLHEMPFENDGTITWELMVERINSDLANTLGNLVNRTISMTNKYLDGVVTNTEVHDSEGFDEELKAVALKTSITAKDKMAELRVADAITAVFDLFKRCNKYIDETTPWILGKEEASKPRLQTVLYNLVNSITIGASLLEPFMPDTAASIYKQLNTEAVPFDKMDVYEQYKSGNKVTDKPEILFARLDAEEVMAKVNELYGANDDVKYPEVEKKEEISIDDFAKVQIQVGEVLECEKLKKSKKLLVSQIRVGNEVRQIVSGIANYYSPEDMVGKKVAVITNLKPAKLCGVESQGMILAAGDDEGNLSVLTVDKDIISGSEIS
ncbi:MAG TPA: methionine--tRNA ligase subunit beta, partial [Eubacterium sp.]|nr:methionine--tRNA ligase subunit beta [Eubacterium sp.]